MNVVVRQIYIEPGVAFPFSHHFQRRLAREVAALVDPSPKFISKYGSDCKLVFNVSAKRDIQVNEVRGPSFFKKTKDLEYTVFLPFDVISADFEVMRSALRFLLMGVCATLQQLDIDTRKITEQQESMIDSICSDSTMFRHEA